MASALIHNQLLRLGLLRKLQGRVKAFRSLKHTPETTRRLYSTTIMYAANKLFSKYSTMFENFQFFFSEFKKSLANLSS